MSVNLTPQKSAVFSAIVGKTDTLRIKELAIVGKTKMASKALAWGVKIAFGVLAILVGRVAGVETLGYFMAGVITAANFDEIAKWGK